MRDFFAAVLPAQGVYFIAAKTPLGFPHQACQSFDEMEDWARRFDGQGHNTYFACASFQQPSCTDVDGKTRQRTQDNAGWAKSFWLDIDCGKDKADGGKGYATLRDADVALGKFVAALQLPRPTVVLSGGGLHVYWPLSDTIAKEQWKPVADHLKALTRHSAFRLNADDSRTSDIASILRPVGTHNHKPARGGSEVQLRIIGNPTAFEELKEIIEQAHYTHVAGAARGSGLQFGALHTAYNPETPENIARVKSALSAINPDCEYSAWRDICFAIHATGWSCAEELARSWSMGKFK